LRGTLRIWRQLRPRSQTQNSLGSRDAVCLGLLRGIYRRETSDLGCRYRSGPYRAGADSGGIEKEFESGPGQTRRYPPETYHVKFSRWHYGMMMRGSSLGVPTGSGKRSRRNRRNARERGRPFVSFLQTRSRKTSRRKISDSFGEVMPVRSVSCFRKLLTDSARCL